MNTDYVSFAIAQLILSDYEVFTSLSNRTVVALEFDRLQKCKIVKPSICKDGLKVNLPNLTDFSFVLVSETTTQQCWLIPVDSIKSEEAFRVTQKHEFYRLAYNRIEKLEQMQNAKDLTAERVIQAAKESQAKLHVPADASIMDLLRRKDGKD